MRLANAVSYMHPWDHERSGRGNQSKDPVRQAARGRLPQQRELQDSDLFYCGGLDLHPH
ncbi:hypothetical protein Pla52o_55740 [Novipirellula galeiformis]|uniref:Uncharacterized protein n=1 Tax=Novipirellula galeiformis TaxID=2528004 RepID=A0A5C6BTP2_9BACT|nr:hypothetical protein Pla52o_55740 [Novipirellula galeiformis]